jgi:hypothetical protein
MSNKKEEWPSLVQRVRRDPFFGLWFGAFFGAISGYMLNSLASSRPICTPGWALAQLPVVPDLFRIGCITIYFGASTLLVLAILWWAHDHVLPRLLKVYQDED